MGFSIDTLPLHPPSTHQRLKMDLLFAHNAVTNATMPLHLRHLHHYHDNATASFSWSDFPLIVHNEDFNDCLAMRKSPPTACPEFSMAPFCTSRRTAATATATTPSTAATAFSTPTQSRKKKPYRIRFASRVEIRTHSVILGDHPWCEDGLSLDLGWDYNDSVVDIARSSKDNKHSRRRNESSNRNSNSSPHRRSYLERKRVLLEVGGYTERELQLQLEEANNFGTSMSRVGSIKEHLDGSGMTQ